MRRGYGVKRRKRFGPLRRCDSRRVRCGSDCATGSRPSPGIGRGRSLLTQSRRDDEGCARSGSLRKSAQIRRVIRCVQQHVGFANENSPVSGKFTGVSKCVEETSWHFCRSCRCSSPNLPMNLMLCAMRLNKRSSRVGSSSRCMSTTSVHRLGDPAPAAGEGGDHQCRFP
jgi:hypothetical protein